jgi:hypothetical protein
MPSTSTYSVTRDQIITSSLRKLGVLELGDTPDAATLANATLVLNLMVKQWQTDGIKLWTTTEYTLPFVANQNSYTVGPDITNDLVADRPMKLIQAWLRNSTVSPAIDTPLQILSKQQYDILGSKFSTGVSNSVYMFPSTIYSTLKFYLTPIAAQVAMYTVRFVARRPLYDILNPTDNPDFPNEWMQSLVWGLADQLALEYSVPLNHRTEIANKAMTYKDQMEGWDVEAESTFFVPDMRMGMGRG